jgi:hypothetical protein
MKTPLDSTMFRYGNLSISLTGPCSQPSKCPNLTTPAPECTQPSKCPNLTTPAPECVQPSKCPNLTTPQRQVLATSADLLILQRQLEKELHRS